MLLVGFKQKISSGLSPCPTKAKLGFGRLVQFETKVRVRDGAVHLNFVFFVQASLSAYLRPPTQPILSSLQGSGYVAPGLFQCSLFSSMTDTRGICSELFIFSFFMR